MEKNINLSKEDIKKSVEYEWRKSQIKLYLNLWIFTSIFSILVPVFVTINSVSSLGIAMLAWLGIVVFYFIIFGSFMLFSYMKMNYLLKYYKSFSIHEAKLEKISTSYMYRGAIYYTVIIDSNRLETNALFSSSWLSKFTPEEYNNKRVIGFVDKELQKFYIIKKLDA